MPEKISKIDLAEKEAIITITLSHTQPHLSLQNKVLLRSFYLLSFEMTLLLTLKLTGSDV